RARGPRRLEHLGRRSVPGPAPPRTNRLSDVYIRRETSRVEPRTPVGARVYRARPATESTAARALCGLIRNRPSAPVRVVAGRGHGIDPDQEDPTMGHLLDRCDIIDMLEESAMLHIPVVVELRNGRTFEDRVTQIGKYNGEDWVA